jgi:hypothetical protein
MRVLDVANAIASIRQVRGQSLRISRRDEAAIPNQLMRNV